ncbi:MAG TPA: phosphoribosylaminoimidazolesuccinocarboxamide synthase [Phycisphaerae bacterium]|jgi:phosphoribosylaminoimidazole-succinocarboxamide synthase|nr:phosphoribosylaminoimidazolesuccinocarboxamide synthase [Phycisphaerae bacterium]HOB74041.1 phosphoribosylaminoimidazolesuccinocarboxamide synthase [Phycisphaerae bacterium]HOJ53828.1 phosphoribosylaminoimidazolesuccinocarboxamide synthase [Phycisphaerae bacterium]HOL26159.1 phosphoribosylaminoimidazolesuccinocarboxamide synthase [Phycisphaerae bacterium]HPP20146.1 phosphoribosylaminoimidazolesuccinocarboxamide synthase [Phycisphaerae bacterium]
MDVGKVILQTNIPGIPVRRGKVRDIYDLGDKLLLVATDRISAFDVVMPNGIPYKGEVLTRISHFWLRRFESVPNHLIELVEDRAPSGLEDYLDQLRGRAMLCRKARVVPIECVVRGYITGSGWKEYQAGGTVCGIKLPAGLRQCDPLPEPIFTPATKEESGHDINISFERACELVGRDVMTQLRDHSLMVYNEAARYARERGVIIADTKFEWGFEGDDLILIDEVLTPDSSRFWPADQYAPGRDQPSFDKQYVRNYLETLNWNKTPPGPELPPEVVQGTSQKYIEAYERLTGERFPAR